MYIQYFIGILVLCAAGVLRGDYQDLEMTVIPSSLTAAHGTNQTLTCSYNISDTASAVRVTWSKSTGITRDLVWCAYYTTTSSTSYAFIGYEQKVTGAAASPTIFSSCYITLLNIQQEDAGEYGCYVQYWLAGRMYAGDRPSPFITLTVQSPPQPKLTVYSIDETGQPTLDIIEGAQSYVQCESPPTVPDDDVTITIRKDTENKNCYIPSGISGVHMCRVDVTFSRSDNKAGNWWCQATWRGVNYDTRPHLVDVQFSARNVIMTQPFPPSVTEGSSVSATCETDSANPTAVITWTRQGVVISESDRYTIATSEEKGDFNENISISTLSFIATLDQNGTSFDCRLLQQQSRLMSQNSVLYVQVSARYVIMTQPFPPSVTEGSRVSLTCETDSANPTEVITWTRQGVVISESDRYTIATSEEKGDFNANISISTLSFIATLDQNGTSFDCILLQQQSRLMSQNSVLYVQGHAPTPVGITPAIIGGAVAAAVIVILIVVALLIRTRRQHQAARATPAASGAPSMALIASLHTAPSGGILPEQHQGQHGSTEDDSDDVEVPGGDTHHYEAIDDISLEPLQPYDITEDTYLKPTQTYERTRDTYVEPTPAYTSLTVAPPLHDNQQ